MQIIGFVNVSRPGDVKRLVKWEESWVPVGDGYEARTLNPTIWEWTYLDVSNPRRIEYTGPEFRWVPTAISIMPMGAQQWTHEMASLVSSPWPKDAPTETEYVRRNRIMVIRAATHVDPEKGETEPDWSNWRDESSSVPVERAAA